MRIRNAYEAFWFLTEHPKFRCRLAHIASEEDTKRRKGSRIRIYKDSLPWCKDKTYRVREYAAYTEAMEVNLDIFFAKVDRARKVNDDKSKNIFVECWLEFGPIKNVIEDGTLIRRNCHDINLDCGAPTFDEALIKLARLVKKHYGDFDRAVR